MIRISQIDSEFSIYKNNIVVLLRKDEINDNLFRLLKYNKVTPKYICDPNKQHWGKVVRNMPVISPKQLNLMVKEQKKTKNKGIVVQVVSNKIENTLIEKILSYGVKSVISYNEAYHILNYLNKLDYMGKSSNSIKIYEPLTKQYRILNNSRNLFNYFCNKIYLKQYLLICSIQKTGDITLKETFKFNNIPSKFVAHTPEALNKKIAESFGKKIKVITGVRDPISQNLSFLYQHISNIFSSDFSYHLNLNSEEFFKNGGDAQILFDLGFGKAKGFNNLEPYSDNFTYLGDFMTRFKNNIIDLSQFPFDKEKGYTIVREGHIEVFVYQLEKLNDIAKEMSDWIGQTQFDKWVVANEASNKWIADSYNQAKKEITFSQEYFDRCYNDPWVQHFYSQEDIEKFKEKWRPHIK